MREFLVITSLYLGVFYSASAFSAPRCDRPEVHCYKYNDNGAAYFDDLRLGDEIYFTDIPDDHSYDLLVSSPYRQINEITPESGFIKLPITEDLLKNRLIFTQMRHFDANKNRVYSSDLSYGRFNFSKIYSQPIIKGIDLTVFNKETGSSESYELDNVKPLELSLSRKHILKLKLKTSGDRNGYKVVEIAAKPLLHGLPYGDPLFFKQGSVYVNIDFDLESLLTSSPPNFKFSIFGAVTNYDDIHGQSITGQQKLYLRNTLVGGKTDDVFAGNSVEGSWPGIIINYTSY